jgi:cytochrome c-type biogenesis protein CcmH
MKKFIIFLIALLLPALPLLAAEDFYHFENPQQHARFTALTSDLRCLVCQNQNLAESNAPLANDLRQQIYQQVLQGRTDQQITNYLVTRYGDFILYSPPVRAATLGLWFGPGFMLLAGLGYLLFYIHQNRRRQTSD